MGVWFHHPMCLSMGKKRADGLGKIITNSTLWIISGNIKSHYTPNVMCAGCVQMMYKTGVRVANDKHLSVLLDRPSRPSNTRLR
jgi:hypothetical protein